MIRGLRTLLAVAAMAGAGTAFAADEDTMRLGRFKPDDTAADTKTLQTTPDDDTVLIHGFRRGFYGGGFGYGRSYYGGGFGYGRSYYGGYGYGNGGYYGGGFGFGNGGYYGGYGRGYFGSYYGGYPHPYYSSYYYAPPVYYTAPVYYDPYQCFSTGYYGALPISGSDAATVPLQTNYFSEYLSAARPAPAPATDVPVRAEPVPVPSVPDEVRVSRPAQPTPSKYKYAAYGEKQ